MQFMFMKNREFLLILITSHCVEVHFLGRNALFYDLAEFSYINFPNSIAGSYRTLYYWPEIGADRAAEELLLTSVKLWAVVHDTFATGRSPIHVWRAKVKNDVCIATDSRNEHDKKIITAGRRRENRRNKAVSFRFHVGRERPPRELVSKKKLPLPPGPDVSFLAKGCATRWNAFFPFIHLFVLFVFRRANGCYWPLIRITHCMV